MKLQWKDIDDKKITFEEAKSFEMDGWKIPEIKDLKKAYITKKQNSLFKKSIYWSCTKRKGFNNNVKTFDFETGSDTLEHESFLYYAKLCKEIK